MPRPTGHRNGHKAHRKESAMNANTTPATEAAETITVCRRCETPVSFDEVSDGYYAVCPEHYEDLYKVETKEIQVGANTTPEQVFKDLATQLSTNENGDKLFTGDTEAALKFLSECDDLILPLKQIEHNGDHVVLYDAQDNYWGSGPDTETATRYLIGAILDPGDE